MACHETKVGDELPCVGWLVHQLGPGNNIGLRLAVIHGRVNGNVKTVGPQHETFEDTLPKSDDEIDWGDEEADDEIDWGDEGED